MSDKPIIKNVNEHVYDLPDCPFCDSITELDEIRIKVLASGGGGLMVAYMLSCEKTKQANLLGSEPQCTFSVPMTWKQPPLSTTTRTR